MQSRFFLFLLLMLSIATAVLPVWRSPISSSRWPRPMGIMLSIALMPVCTGVFTDWRVITPGATRSMGRLIGNDGSFIVERRAQGVYHAANQCVTHWH